MGVGVAEIAGDEDLVEESFGFGGFHGGRWEGEFVGREAEDVRGDESEFLPYGGHPVFVELLPEQAGVNGRVVCMEVHGPVAELTESDASCRHVADGVVENEEGVECGWGEAYGSAGVVPFGEEGSAEITVYAADGPLLEILVHLCYGHVIGLFMELDLDRVEAYLDMVVTFDSYFHTFVFQAGNGFACLLEIFFPYIKVDVSAAAAFRTGVVLRRSLSFQQYRRYPGWIQCRKNLVYGPVQNPVHLHIPGPVHHEPVDDFLRRPCFLWQCLNAVEDHSLYGLLTGCLKNLFPAHIAPEKALVGLFSP